MSNHLQCRDETGKNVVRTSISKLSHFQTSDIRCQQQQCWLRFSAHSLGILYHNKLYFIFILEFRNNSVDSEFKLGGLFLSVPQLILSASATGLIALPTGAPLLMMVFVRWYLLRPCLQSCPADIFNDPIFIRYSVFSYFPPRFFLQCTYVFQFRKWYLTK